jgi:hypothetical protein
MVHATGWGWVGLGLMTGLLAIDTVRRTRRRRQRQAEIDAFMEWDVSPPGRRYPRSERGSSVPPPQLQFRGKGNHVAN